MNSHNMLMQLRKCLQHPYLYNADLEPKDSPDVHQKLIDASAKLRFLRPLLNKLKSRGHRVLIFSQFVIALNIIEDFLVGEGHKYLRLDGNVKQHQRQRDMDTFNEPGSDVFAYLLTTRAGGVGINLWSADTVIIFDPDFNPHQDLQVTLLSEKFVLVD
jgi:chromodomain-helicase-DNA-binding protein 4